jgi:hypothetical protein
MFQVPAPEKVIWQPVAAVVPVVPVVTVPATVSVPVERVITFLRAPDETVVAAMVSEPQDTEPAPIARVTFLLVDGRGMLISPLTVRVLVPPIVSVLLAVAAAQVSEEQVAEISTVTLTPLLMVTVSPATGTALPPQVLVLLQLPETLAVRAAP